MAPDIKLMWILNTVCMHEVYNNKFALDLIRYSTEHDSFYAFLTLVPS